MGNRYLKLLKELRKKGLPEEEAKRLAKEQLRKEGETTFLNLVKENQILHANDGKTYFKVGDIIYYMETRRFYELKNKILRNHEEEWKDLSPLDKELKILPNLTWYSKKLRDFSEEDKEEWEFSQYGNFTIVGKQKVKQREGEFHWKRIGDYLPESTSKRRTRMKPIEVEEKDDIISKISRKVLKWLRRED